MKKIEINRDYLEMVEGYSDAKEWEDSTRNDFLTKGLTMMKNGERYAMSHWRIDIDYYCKYEGIEVPTQQDFDDLLTYYKQCDIEFYIEEIKNILDTFKDDNDDSYLEDVEKCISYIKELSAK